MINLHRMSHLTTNVHFGNVTDKPTEPAGSSLYLGYDAKKKKDLWVTGQDKIDLTTAREAVREAHKAAPTHPRLFGVIPTAALEKSEQALDALKQKLFAKYH